MDRSLDDNSQGLRCLAGITPVFVLGLLCFSARILSRIIPTYRLSASDYINASAVVSTGICGPIEEAMAVLTVRIGLNHRGILAIRGKPP